MSSRRKKTNSTSTLKKSLSMLKALNKDMALNMQRLKEDLTNTINQNLSLKGELYETLVDRNCLWEKNTRLIELLRTLQAECMAFRERIDDLLSPSRNRSSSKLSVGTTGFPRDARNPETPRERFLTIRNGEFCSVQNDRVNYTNNFEPAILCTRKSPSATYRRPQDTNNLSPITEEHSEDAVTSRLGRRSRLTQSIAPMRNSGCEDAFPSMKSSLERKLSGCMIFRNLDEPNTSPTNIRCKEDTMDLDTIYENKKSTDEALLGRTSLASRRTSLASKRTSSAKRRSSSLLTINIMQQQNDPQESPPMIMNVFPRKRRYASKLSLNDGFLDAGLSEETENSVERKDYDPTNSKVPAVILERIPLPEKPPSPIGNADGPKIEPKVSIIPACEKRKSTKKSGRPSVNKYQNTADKRRSIRNREAMSCTD